MLDSKYLIINRKAQKFSVAKTSGDVLTFASADGAQLIGGSINLDDSVYAALYCDEVFNTTLVINKAGTQTVVTILWNTEEEYKAGLDILRDNLKTELSRQNLKINRYAESIAEKLSIGVELRVTDAVDESEMIKCPECGMMNDKDSMYCMDCGADLP